MDRANTYEQYKKLKKPWFAPPQWLFGPVWTVLYIIIALSFGYTFLLWTKGEIYFLILLPFLLNLVFNLLFTTIQFKLRNYILAALDIIVVDVTLLWAMVAIFPFSPIVTFAQIPYLAWGLFATIVQLSVTWLNR